MLFIFRFHFTSKKNNNKLLITDQHKYVFSEVGEVKIIIITLNKLFWVKSIYRNPNRLYLEGESSLFWKYCNFQNIKLFLLQSVLLFYLWGSSCTLSHPTSFVHKNCHLFYGWPNPIITQMKSKCESDIFFHFHVFGGKFG